MALTFDKARARLDQLFEQVGDEEVTSVELGQPRQDASPEGCRQQRCSADAGVERRHGPRLESLATRLTTSAPAHGAAGAFAGRRGDRPPRRPEQGPRRGSAERRRQVEPAPDSGANDLHP